MYLQPIQKCRAGAVNHVHGPILVPFLLHAPWKAGKKEDVILLISHFTIAFRHPFSLVFLHILKGSCFCYQLPQPCTVGKRVIVSCWIKYSLNLFKYNVENIFPFPHKQLHHHFLMCHQSEKTALIARLLKLCELFLLLLTV